MAFQSKQVEVGCVVAAGMWGATAALILVGTIVGSIQGTVTPAVIGLCSTALALSAGAATATIRTYFVRMDRKVNQFFELGRDYGAGSVRSMRRTD